MRAKILGNGEEQSRRQPNVIVIGGFSMATTKLIERVKEIVRGNPPAVTDGWGGDMVANNEQAFDVRGNPPAVTDGWGGDMVANNEQAFDIPVNVFDEVARIYQHSKQAAMMLCCQLPSIVSFGSV